MWLGNETFQNLRCFVSEKVLKKWTELIPLKDSKSDLDSCYSTKDVNWNVSQMWFPKNSII